jgi:hypothetical protein
LPNHKKVIPLQSPAWQFYDYADEIEKWYLGLSEEASDILNALLKTNSKASLPTNWVGCKMLQGDCKAEGIWEWRFFEDGIQHRLLGIFGKDRKTAVFLIGCSHKDAVYKPPECLATAIKRAKEVRAGKVTLNERKVKSNL